MLMVGLRFILGNEKGVENIGDLLGNFIFSTISDKFCHGMPVNVVRQGVDKLLEILDTIYITNQTVSSTKELGHGAAILDSWGVTHDSVSGNRFISAGKVENGITSLEVFLR